MSLLVGFDDRNPISLLGWLWTPLTGFALVTIHLNSLQMAETLLT